MRRRSTSLLERVIHPDEPDLTADEARAMLRWSFGDKDRNRMRQLVRRGNAGELTEAEHEELEEFRQVGLMLDLVHAKARHALSRDADR